ncbi:MAG: DUF6452 family protein [Bacteroidota bacterium]
MNSIKPAKSIILTLSIILALAYFASCEKDDICVDGDTPLLVIKFYDAEDTTMTKEVTGLQVNGLIIGEDTLDIVANTALDSIQLPLRTTENNTSFLISQTLSNPDTTLTNILTFSYEVQPEFISRACGYVANYNALEGTALRGVEADSLWIQEIEIEIPLVENSNETHVKIFH